MKPEDRKAAIEAGILKGSAHNSDNHKPKSPISEKLGNDLRCVATGARQHAILRNPDLLLDLLAFQLSHGLNWRSPFGISTTIIPNQPGTEEAGYTLDERLTTGVESEKYDADLAKKLRAFRKKGADHIRAELTRILATQYHGGDEKLQALVDKETKPSIREVWTPTAGNFFKRVNAAYLTDLWCDLLDLAADHPTATTFAKLKKGEKADKLESLFQNAEFREAHSVTDAQAAKIDAWLPEGME